MGYIHFLRANWLFLLAGFLITFTSSYGQTYFISLFAGEIKADFGLTDGQWGGLYTVGTTLSAITMIWSGVLTDKLRVRVLAFVTLIGLALACISMAFVQGWFLLTLTIYALRLTGQGMMSQISAVAMVRWFDASRGKALSLASMGFAVGQALLPIVFVALLVSISWRSLWLLAAGLTVIMIPILQLLLKRERTPQSIAEHSHATGMNDRHWTRAEMLKSGLFYLSIPMVIGPATWGTALFFHQVHFVSTKGWELAQYVALFPAFTLTAIIFTFASGWAVDRFGVSRIITIQLLPFAVSFALMSYTRDTFGAGVALALFGMGQGIQSTALSTFWADYFGTRHIGSIKAVAAALMVFGSAIGPGLTGWLIDSGIGFSDQLMAMAAYFVVATAMIAYGVFKYRPTLNH